MQGKLSIELVNLSVYQNIFRNVSLQLPEGYELVAGTNIHNIHLYYELVKVSVLASTYGIYLALNIPLQTANRHFTLFKAITLPVRVTFDNFIHYFVNFEYFELQHSQHSYILLSEASFNRCNKGSIVVCPADIVIYNVHTIKCGSSLFFKTGSAYPLCQRKLLLQYTTPIVQRYGTVWMYNFAKPHQVTLRCTKYDSDVPRILTLEGTGLLHNISGCHISSPELHAFPELHGQSYAELETPIFYLPDNITVLDEHERQQLKEIPLPNLQKLDEVYNSPSVKTPLRLGLTFAYLSSYNPSRETNPLDNNSFYLTYQYCNSCHFYLFLLHSFPKHLLHNSKSRRRHIDSHELQRTQYNTR
jgi:hypothetical protein